MQIMDKVENKGTTLWLTGISGQENLQLQKLLKIQSRVFIKSK